MKKWIFLSVLLLSSSTFAGDAGCGLGGLIWKSNGKITQLFAVTTNGSFGSQTLGITFGTSGCSASGLVQNEREIRHFAAVNQPELTKEMAQGDGERLYTLASLYGCNAESQKSFAKMAQASFDQLVPTDDISSEKLIDNLNNKVINESICR